MRSSQNLAHFIIAFLTFSLKKNLSLVLSRPDFGFTKSPKARSITSFLVILETQKSQPAVLNVTIFTDPEGTPFCSDLLHGDLEMIHRPEIRMRPGGVLELWHPQIC